MALLFSQIFAIFRYLYSDYVVSRFARGNHIPTIAQKQNFYDFFLSHIAKIGLELEPSRYEDARSTESHSNSH